MFPSYNIQKFQIIYVCHEIVDSSGNIDVYNDIKKYYTNQYGDFWFMKVINIDLNVEKTSLFANKILEDIPKKIKYLNDAKKNSIPITLGNEFVEKTECKFCQYRNTCYKFL